jgi:hypothetical protein
VEIDKDGRSIWVAERCGTNSCAGSNLPSILKFDPSGKLVKSFGEGLLLFPHGIFSRPRRQRLGHRRSGRRHPPAGNGRGHAVRPPAWRDARQSGVEVQSGWKAADDARHARRRRSAWLFLPAKRRSRGPRWAIFVSEGHGGANSRILKFSKDGKLLKTWGTKGAG